MLPAIEVRGLGKKYRIKHQAGNGGLEYQTLRDTVAGGVSRVRKTLFGGGGAEPAPAEEEFWALRNVSFDVGFGDRLGIIGRNGAGKSTLLKLISRITSPSEGSIRLGGRVASLLEVGTGFHPELSGRENIFLNGSILGMKRSEIRKRFDGIVAFAEVERFLDTPVKHYSSGMFVRLAFAVAAHIEPEILIIDEVLAVGDMRFQAKCLGKLDEIGKEGRTLLFVSHNIGMVSSLCTRAVLLDRGGVAASGTVSDVVLRYFTDSESSFSRKVYAEGAFGDETTLLREGRVEAADGRPAREFDLGDPIRIVMEYDLRRSTESRVVPNFHVFGQDGGYVLVDSAPGIGAGLERGAYRAECVIPGHLLNEGVYTVGLAATTYHANHFEASFFDRQALMFHVKESHLDNPRRYGFGGPMPGIVRPLLEWAVKRVGDSHG